jgi:hypothetical protein
MNSGSGMPDKEEYERLVREAESLPLEYNPTDRVKFIRDNLTLINRYILADLTASDIKERLPSFAKEYPHLFEKATEPGADLSMLGGMLHMLDKMGAGKINQHQASVVVGKALSHKYVAAIPGVPGGARTGLVGVDVSDNAQLQ